MEGRTSAEPSPQSALAQTALPRAPLAASAFRPSGSRLMPAKLADVVARTTPGADRAQLHQLFTGLLASYDDLLVREKEQRLANNLAGAIRFLIMVCNYALKDGAELSEEQQEGLLQDLNSTIAAGMKQTPMTDRQKQEMYETTVIAAGFILALYQQGQENQDPEMIHQSKELARTLPSELLGISLDEVQFTKNGMARE
jgi:hypothetical protein